MSYKVALVDVDETLITNTPDEQGKRKLNVVLIELLKNAGFDEIYLVTGRNASRLYPGKDPRDKHASLLSSIKSELERRGLRIAGVSLPYDHYLNEVKPGALVSRAGDFAKKVYLPTEININNPAYPMDLSLPEPIRVMNSLLAEAGKFTNTQGYRSLFDDLELALALKDDTYKVGQINFLIETRLSHVRRDELQIVFFDDTKENLEKVQGALQAKGVSCLTEAVVFSHTHAYKPSPALIALACSVTATSMPTPPSTATPSSTAPSTSTLNSTATSSILATPPLSPTSPPTPARAHTPTADLPLAAGTVSTLLPTSEPATTTVPTLPLISDPATASTLHSAQALRRPAPTSVSPSLDISLATVPVTVSTLPPISDPAIASTLHSAQALRRPAPTPVSPSFMLSILTDDRFFYGMVLQLAAGLLLTTLSLAMFPVIPLGVGLALFTLGSIGTVGFLAHRFFKDKPHARDEKKRVEPLCEPSELGGRI